MADEKTMIYVVVAIVLVMMLQKDSYRKKRMRYAEAPAAPPPPPPPEPTPPPAKVMYKNRVRALRPGTAPYTMQQAPDRNAPYTMQQDVSIASPYVGPSPPGTSWNSQWSGGSMGVGKPISGYTYGGHMGRKLN
jgi:hypothetical protein